MAALPHVLVFKHQKSVFLHFSSLIVLQVNNPLDKLVSLAGFKITSILHLSDFTGDIDPVIRSKLTLKILDVLSLPIDQGLFIAKFL